MMKKPFFTTTTPPPASTPCLSGTTCLHVMLGTLSSLPPLCIYNHHHRHHHNLHNHYKRNTSIMSGLIVVWRQPHMLLCLRRFGSVRHFCDKFSVYIVSSD
uniref:Uncharacterized protein n=1 Tax=Sipha flava TaxID=143950 RepID=A0A2S2Q0J6_9HEMI